SLRSSFIEASASISNVAISLAMAGVAISAAIAAMIVVFLIETPSSVFKKFFRCASRALVRLFVRERRKQTRGQPAREPPPSPQSLAGQGFDEDREKTRVREGGAKRLRGASRDSSA